MKTEIATPLDELSDKQRKFVLQYVQHFGRRRAAIEAGYAEASAHVTANRLLKDAKVSGAIEWFFTENTMTAAEVLHHLTNIARGDIVDVVDNYGAPDLIAAKENHVTMLIKKVKSKTILKDEMDEDGKTEEAEIHIQEIELYDRLKALELLAKYHDLINRTRIDDWRSDAIRYIKNGELAFEPLVEQVGHDLATELFTLAGVPLLPAGVEGED
jgi:phage terminase small subunit